ncbi:MAG: hypothetical protein ABR505_03060 [Actinomycetota bacterium]
MTAVILVVLALAWIAMLGPATVRAKRSTPLSAAQSFKRRMALIAPHSSSGRWVLVPASSSRRARPSFIRSQLFRVRLLQFLIGGVVVTMLAALYGGEGIWELQIFLDLSLAAYVVFLLEAKRRRQGRYVAVPTRALRPTRRREATS